MSKAWTWSAAERLDGKVAVVTGATSGIGFETVLILAQMGAEMIAGARDPARAHATETRIRQQVPSARIRFEPLDLNSLRSVAAFATSIDRADILINNAAVMALPQREQTLDGFERQVGVNYLGHFALTARLLPVLAHTPGEARVVSVASVAHRRAALTLDDFLSQRSYQPMQAYGRSKLAMLMFAQELQRRAAAAGWPIRSVAAHPGWARTNIIPNGMGSGLKGRIAALVFNALAQPAAEGTLPVLFAATAPDAQGGGYYGPAAMGETRGRVGPARIFPQAQDTAAASRLWSLSEALTGVRFALSPS